MIAAFQMPQSPTEQASVAPQGGWFGELARQPGVVELALVLFVVLLAWLSWRRVRGLVDRVQRRKALRDYLLGVEQAESGDLAGAATRLERVLAQDPENHYARLLYGKVLAANGDPAQAHKHHLVLERAFAVQSAGNGLLLAQCLLAVGMPAEAAAAAERALQHEPERQDLLDLLHRAHLAAGDTLAAAAAARRLLPHVAKAPPTARLRRDLAVTLAAAGRLRLRRGDEAEASAELRLAQQLDANEPAVRLLAVQVDADRKGIGPTTTALLGDRSPAADARLPVRGADRAAVAAPAVPARFLQSLVPAARWSCRACGDALDSALPECPRCGSPGSAGVREPALFAPLPSPVQAMDAIDENEAHVRRTVAQALDGKDAAACSAARAEVLALRDKAVPALLREAWQRREDSNETAIELLRAMGPGITPSLFAASDALADQRLLPLGVRSPATVVGRVIQGFDRTALPHFEGLFTRARPEHRKILIDYFLGLGDLAEFQLVLTHLPPLEILHRCNKVPAPVLRRFLQAVPPQHFVAEVLLCDPTFYREDEVLAAIPGARHPEVLEQVLLRRGPTRTLTKVLLAALADAELCEIALRLLLRFGVPVVDHVLAAFTDPDRPAPERHRLAELLAALGPGIVDKLCLQFGPDPSNLDDELRTVLVAIGDGAVQPLQQAYGRSGWLERLGGPLLSRHSNRRVQIVRVLASLGTEDAVLALRQLLQAESDANLRLRLQQALHDLDRGDGGGDVPR